jgi:RNA polymerase sigma-70 factor (ECF subfamily)
MPVELMDAIGGANATSSSPDRLVAQEDAALVAGAKAGDARAFELLVARHEGKIFLVALRITRNREDAEDVAQQSFQKAFIHLKKFEGESLFSTAGDETSSPLDIPDLGPNPEDNCLRREQERILSAAVNDLTPGVRKAIELRELGELSTGETAQVMGLSVGAVKGRVFHGRKKLRQTLERYVESTRTYGTRALRTRRAVRDRSRAILELRPVC